MNRTQQPLFLKIGQNEDNNTHLSLFSCVKLKSKYQWIFASSAGKGKNSFVQFILLHCVRLCVFADLCGYILENMQSLSTMAMPSLLFSRFFGDKCCMVQEALKSVCTLARVRDIFPRKFGFLRGLGTVQRSCVSCCHYMSGYLFEFQSAVSSGPYASKVPSAVFAAYWHAGRAVCLGATGGG